MSRTRPGCDRVAALLALAMSCLLAGAPSTGTASERRGIASDRSATHPIAAPTVSLEHGVTPPAGTPRLGLAALLETARRWIDAGRAQDAWRALDARVDDYAGDPEFDYLLGLAALDSGRPGQAVFALERALMVRPDFLQARAEIARAYFEIHERENARREFEMVASQEIPDEARRVIGRYLDAIRRVDASGRPVLGGLLELEAGYDSNVNFGSSSGQWVLADGTAVIPLGLSRPRSSAFVSAAAGLEWTVPISGAWHWTVGGRASIRRHPSAHTLDQDQYDLASGFAYRNGCHQFNMLAQTQHLQLGGADFRNAMGVLGQWQCDIDSRTRVGAYVQRFVFDFPDEPARDAHRNGVGLTFARVLEGTGRPIAVGSLYGGNETYDADWAICRTHYRGLRLALSRGIGSNWRGFASASYETRGFDALEPFFGVVRDDRQAELRIGAERPLDKHWSIAPMLAFTRNRSTLAPNDFRRTQASLVMRYRFR